MGIKEGVNVYVSNEEGGLMFFKYNYFCKSSGSKEEYSTNY
jgi:hypothetical protein